MCLFREEFAIQNCILQTSGSGTVPSGGTGGNGGGANLTVSVGISNNSSGSAHTENTALLANVRTIKMNPITS